MAGLESGLEDAVGDSVAEVKDHRDQVDVNPSNSLEERVERLEEELRSRNGLEERVEELEKGFEGEMFEEDLEVREDLDELRNQVEELSELLVEVVERMDG